jgi:L-threonylcarbamoyladenylate synthase
MRSIVSSHSPDAVLRAVKVLNEGGLVGLPTETVYGLAARTDNNDAVAKIFQAKGRPTGHPLIVHIADISDVRRYSINIPSVAMSLVEQCWPGPLTLLLHKSSEVSHLVTGGRDTVAIRIPANECARRIIDQCGHGLAAPSANVFGHVSPSTAQHVLDDLGDLVDLIVDDGDCSIGVESTIVDFTAPEPQLLRPGGFPIEDLESIMGTKLAMPSGESRASGMLASHYAPKGKVTLVNNFAEALTIREANPQSRILDYADNSPLYAATLYTQMRQADHDGIEMIIAILPSKTGLGTAIHDRLTRAAFL